MIRLVVVLSVFVSPVSQAWAYPTWRGVVEKDGKIVECVADISVPQLELSDSEKALLHRISERDKVKGSYAILWCGPAVNMNGRFINSGQQVRKLFLKDGATYLQKLWHTQVIVPEVDESPLMPLCAAWLLSPQNIEQNDLQMRTLKANYQHVNTNDVNEYMQQVYDTQQYALESVHSPEMQNQRKAFEHSTMADIRKSLLADVKGVLSYVGRHNSRRSEDFFTAWWEHYIALSGSLNKYGFDDTSLFEQVKKRIEEKGLEGSLKDVPDPQELDLEYTNMCRLKDVFQNQQKQVLLYAAPQTAYFVFKKLVSKFGYEKKYESSAIEFPTTIRGWSSWAEEIDAKRNESELKNGTVVDEMKALFKELPVEEWQD